MRKFMSLLVALGLVLGLSVPSFAQEEKKDGTEKKMKKKKKKKTDETDKN